MVFVCCPRDCLFHVGIVYYCYVKLLNQLAISSKQLVKRCISYYYYGGCWLQLRKCAVQLLILEARQVLDVHEVM